MELSILHALCTAGAQSDDAKGILKRVALRVGRSHSSACDDIIFIKDGTQVASILRNQAHVPFNVEIYNSGTADDHQHSDLMYLPASSMGFESMPASISLSIGLSEKRFNELYQDIKAGNPPKMIQFRFIETFTDLPTGISVAGHAPDAPLYWDLDTIRRLPVWDITFQYGNKYEVEIDNQENIKEKEANNKSEIFNEVNLIKQKFDNIQETLKSIEAMAASQISVSNAIKNIIIFVIIIEIISYIIPKP